MTEPIVSERPYSSVDILNAVHPANQSENAIAVVLNNDGSIGTRFATGGEWVDGAFLSLYPYVKYGWGGAGVDLL